MQQFKHLLLATQIVYGGALTESTPLTKRGCIQREDFDMVEALDAELVATWVAPLEVCEANQFTLLGIACHT